jgi:Domain of unknown function (DUF1929)
LVRPMAVTHQTDTEQRVIELPFLHDHTHPRRLVLTAPDRGYPHSLAPSGYYMLFIFNRDGVPSVAHWIHLGLHHAIVFEVGSTVTAISTRPGATSLYVVGLDEGKGGGRVWSKFFPDPDNPNQW